MMVFEGMGSARGIVIDMIVNFIIIIAEAIKVNLLAYLHQHKSFSKPKSLFNIHLKFPSPTHPTMSTSYLPIPFNPSSFIIDSMYWSISLPPDAGKARSVDIFRYRRKHLRMHPQVTDRLEFSLLDGHGFCCESLAHSLGLDSSLIWFDSSCAVVASFPADCDGRIVAALVEGYKVKVSMQAA